MQFDKYQVQRFLALSYLYFRLTDKTASTIDREELTEFIVAINDCSPPPLLPGTTYGLVTGAPYRLWIPAIPCDPGYVFWPVTYPVSDQLSCYWAGSVVPGGGYPVPW
jgi:hypothetical protein